MSNTGACAAVLGCGLMGSAVARALAEAGHKIVVWNRTPEKAQALVGTNIRAASTVLVAVEAVPLVVSVLVDYDSFRSAIGNGSFLAGKTVLNLSTGSPAQAVEMQTWMNEQGATYLDGAIFAYPQNIGDPDCMVVHAGPAAVFAELESTLLVLGRASILVSEEIGGANALDGGLSGAFYLSALVAFIESAAYVRSTGVSSEAVRSAMRTVLDVLTQQIDEVVRDLDTGSHATDQATISGYAAAGRRWHSTVESAGHRATLLQAANQLLDSAQEAGLGDLGISAIARQPRRE